MSTNAKEVIRKYLKKVKPLYEKLSQKQQQQQKIPSKPDGSIKETSQISAHENPRKELNNNIASISHSFSGNLRYPRRRNCIVSSCPSSMRSSPSHSGILSKNGFNVQPVNRTRESMYGYPDSSSSMEELQSAIQGAIAHCKNSMIQNKPMVSNEI
ncbi:putative membrane-associated kinase regulator 1 [Forsythia ovata]|uniref:Membrane-associated kinase regulator 1 n=1 Tax=Forsythia ovata TaxID=205694 RepID=A0ABD1UZK2_9LAMI